MPKLERYNDLRSQRAHKHAKRDSDQGKRESQLVTKVQQ